LAPAGYGKTAMLHAAASAAIADGRSVVAVATTAKAVAELTDAGLPAVTIARFRLDLGEGSLASGVVVVLDEASQTSTRDAHTVVGAVADCPGAQLWILGDPRQAPSVKAGGIAAELDTRARAGVVAAATLTVNRRQVDPVDRHALALLRAGDPVASQALRVGHGWEHDAGTPAATRAGMADTVVADIVDHGSESTVALVVSHGQAEDLADRVRRRPITAGMLTGPTLTGPGWTSDRTYQTGDRILFHTRHGDRHSPLLNGTVATVTAVDRHGLTVRTDTGAAVVVVSAGFVRGVRADGTPNLSHAWARTVDGAQGGSWDHAHLLGSAALDAYRGYTGQSRSRHPTHTWNTAPVDDADHGGRLADQRAAGEQVAAALARIPDTTMAAVDDPWPTDRRLRTTIAAHHAALDRRPPDRTAELAAARRAVAAAHEQLASADTQRERTRTDLDRLGALHGLSRPGRAERRRLEDRLGADQQAVIDAAGVLAGAEHRVERLEHDQHRHEGFEQTEGWRRHALTATVDALQAHWTEVALSCCRGDDPLAFGVEPLRVARRRLGGELADLDASLPADRAAERRDVRTRLAELVAERRAAQRDLTAAINQHDQLCRHRWPRRDSHAIGIAADHLRQARDHLDQARHAEPDAAVRLAELDAHQAARRRAVDTTAPQRAELVSDLAVIDTSLEQTRPERVVAALGRPKPWHLDLLGRIPAGPAARAVWCDAANRIEIHLDRHASDERGWLQVCDDVADTAELCAVAEHHLALDAPTAHEYEWTHVAAQARAVRDELFVDASRRSQPDRQTDCVDVGFDW
jgi:hypothetical protein